MRTAAHPLLPAERLLRRAGGWALAGFVSLALLGPAAAETSGRQLAFKQDAPSRHQPAVGGTQTAFLSPYRARRLEGLLPDPEAACLPIEAPLAQNRTAG